MDGEGEEGGENEGAAETKGLGLVSGRKDLFGLSGLSVLSCLHLLPLSFLVRTVEYEYWKLL